MDEKQIQKALQTIMHPKLKKSLIDTGMIFQTIAQEISDKTK